MAMALHCHLALLKTKENNGDMKKKNTAMEVQLRNKNNRIVLLL